MTLPDYVCGSLNLKFKLPLKDNIDWECSGKIGKLNVSHFDVENLKQICWFSDFWNVSLNVKTMSAVPSSISVLMMRINTDYHQYLTELSNLN